MSDFTVNITFSQKQEEGNKTFQTANTIQEEIVSKTDLGHGVSIVNLPSYYTTEWTTNDDGELNFSIKNGAELNDDGELGYKFSAQIVTGSDPEANSENSVINKLKQPEGDVSTYFFGDNPKAALYSFVFPIELMGIHITTLLTLSAVIEINSNDYIQVMVAGVNSANEDADDTYYVRELIEVLKYIRVEGMCLEVEKLSYDEITNVLIRGGKQKVIEVLKK